MKIFTKSVLVSLIASAFIATSANAGWMVVNDDGSMVPYTEDCCHVSVKPVKRVRKARKNCCATCDYSRFPEAEVMPLEPGERLRPARLGFCGK